MGMCVVNRKPTQCVLLFGRLGSSSWDCGSVDLNVVLDRCVSSHEQPEEIFSRRSFCCTGFRALWMLYVREVCQVSWYQGVQEKSSMDCHGTSEDRLWGLLGALDIPAFGRCIVQRECLDVLRAFHNMAVGRCPLGLSGKLARMSFRKDRSPRGDQ
jgi:hypothetical protein